MEVIFISLISTAAIIGLLDLLWLSTMGKGFYREQLGGLLHDKPNMAAALLFYALYTFGVVLFVLLPAFEQHSWSHALTLGALFGLVTYGTYDLTNLATLKGFTVKLVIIDLLWGMVLTSISATAAFFVMEALL